MKRYKDIINLPHYEPKNHPRMSMEARAAQFAPFAALTGYGESVKETSRITENRIEIDDEERNKINIKLNMLKENILEYSEAIITYFIPDGMKDGGKYVTIKGQVKKIDEYNKEVVFKDGTYIPINEIIEII